jgi:starch phosphorylase
MISSMQAVKTFHVRPALPERLQELEELAYNLRWSWDHETIALFRRLDPALWEASDHNPVLVLGSIAQERLQELEQDDAFVAHVHLVAAGLRDYLANPCTWFQKHYGRGPRPLAAYFSMEFGLTECLPIYSGGLGTLAGDHLKSASDLGVPLFGVGLLYQKGYFRQYLTSDGWQQERHPSNDFSVMPLRPVYAGDGTPLRVGLELGNHSLLLRPWHVQVGRVTLFLLDANIPENPPELRDVTSELYGGDSEMRIRQEIVLGVGGVRALRALGLDPLVFHMNEGACAFLGFERIRELMHERQMSFREALEVVAGSSVFTTHTPVPAGIDVFSADQIERYFGSFRRLSGLTLESFLDLGRMQPGRNEEFFNMAVLAIRTSRTVNGVSRLHARISRKMWRALWPDVPTDEIPIAHVTNGVHPQSWISNEFRTLYDSYLGPGWAEQSGDTRVWRRSEQIPTEELWRTHERRRERLIAFSRRRLAVQLRRRGAGAPEVAEVEQALDPKALTIGFGRRFATYKRATLLLLDLARLDRILNSPDRPVQILFAGKAHPADEPGKDLIRQIVQATRRPELRRRIVFLEDYDQNVARHLVQGVDVWLNTPMRPLEASGTSGMKAVFNGALNISVLDGWWDEAYAPGFGWAIGQGEEYDDQGYRDRVEAGALFDLLENEVVPLFYQRGPDNVPHGWMTFMRSAMATLCPLYNTNRMVHDYVVHSYLPADERRAGLERDDFQRARSLARWKERVAAGWPGVQVIRVETTLPEQTRVGSAIDVRAWIRTGALDAADVLPQVYLGKLHEGRDIVEAAIVPMEYQGIAAAEVLFRAVIPCRTSGTIGLTVRVVPRHVDLAHPHETGLITWAT